MDRFIIKEFTKKDGSTIYIVYEKVKTYSKGGLEWNSLEPRYQGSLKDCEEKIKELEVK